MNALVVGYGSAGERHARVLKELGCRVAICSRRKRPEGEPPEWFPDLDGAVKTFHPTYCVVANESAAHAETAEALWRVGFRGTLLVEKPLFTSAPQHALSQSDRIRVAYNLRFHPLVARLADFARRNTVVAAVAYVGQYLPDWRPTSNPRKSYSTSRAAGGGVLRDLSHELDYLRWTLGEIRELTAIGGRFASVTVDSDDVFSLLWRSDRCPAVSLHVNYLDRISRREVTFVAPDHTLFVDLVKGTYVSDVGTGSVAVARDDTYREMHRSTLAGGGPAATYEDGAALARIVDAAERAAVQRIWVTP